MCRLSALPLALLLLAPLPAAASVVDFTYTQTDAATGSGTITGNIDTSPVLGPGMLTFTGALPSATVIQNDPAPGGVPIPSSMVGFATTSGSPISGIDSGVYLGFSGSVTLSASSGGDLYEIDVPLVIPGGVPYSYDFTLTDDNSGAGGSNDAVGTAGDQRVEPAGWVGDYLAGHRYSSGDDLLFDAGVDNHTASHSFDSGGNATGDNLGITVAMKDGFTGVIFVDEVTFGGTLEADDGTLTVNGVVPELPGVIAGTSFEVPTAVDDSVKYDDGGVTGARDLVNGNGPTVDFTAAGGEIGFDLFYNESGDNLSSRNNRLGVTDAFPNGADSFMPTDGSQAYVMTNTGNGGNDGVELFFDPVDVSNYYSVFATLDTFAKDGGWDNTDFIEVVVEADDGTTLTEIPLLEIGGPFGGNVNSIEGVVQPLLTSLPAGTQTAQLIVRFSSSGNPDEVFYIDKVAFLGFRVPEPSTAALALLGLVGLAVPLRRRRRA